MKRVLMWAGALALAALGVWLYAWDPRDLTYWANFFLIMPLGWLVLEVAGRRLPYRLQWAIAIPLAVAGVVAYLVWTNEQWFNYGALCALPFSLLAWQRADRLRDKDDLYAGGPADGPWGLP